MVATWSYPVLSLASWSRTACKPAIRWAIRAELSEADTIPRVVPGVTVRVMRVMRVRYAASCRSCRTTWSCRNHPAVCRIRRLRPARPPSLRDTRGKPRNAGVATLASGSNSRVSRRQAGRVRAGARGQVDQPRGVASPASRCSRSVGIRAALITRTTHA